MMNVIVWLLTGGVISWLASLVMKTDYQEEIVIFIWSWARQRRERLCDFACSSMGSRRTLLTESTLTIKATARLPNSECIS